MTAKRKGLAVRWGLKQLGDYCLNSGHLRGRRKARVFAAVLAITAQNAQILRKALVQAAIQLDAIPSHRDHRDAYGR